MMNKKAMLGAVFDLLLSFGMLVVLLLIFGIFIKGSFDTVEERSVAAQSGFSRQEARIANLNVAVHTQDLSVIDLNEKLSHLDATTITECRHYLTKQDCIDDFMSLSTKNLHICEWNEPKGECS